MSAQWKKTQEGRIVYDRKPHRWKASDVIRVIKNSDTDFTNLALPILQSLLIELLKLLVAALLKFVSRVGKLSSSSLVYEALFELVATALGELVGREARRTALALLGLRDPADDLTPYAEEPGPMI